MVTGQRVSLCKALQHDVSRPGDGASLKILKLRTLVTSGSLSVRILVWFALNQLKILSTSDIYNTS